MSPVGSSPIAPTIFRYCFRKGCYCQIAAFLLRWARQRARKAWTLNFEGRSYVAKNKQTYSVVLEADQMDFVSQLKDQYGIADEDKVLRITLDFLLANPQLQPQIYSEERCMRCD